MVAALLLAGAMHLEVSFSRPKLTSVSGLVCVTISQNGIDVRVESSVVLGVVVFVVVVRLMNYMAVPEFDMLYVCVCVCVCMIWKRERKRERE